MFGMQRRLVSISTALLVSALPTQIAASNIACPGFVDGRASRVEADHFFALQAVEIISAALARDEDKLKRLVSPQAEFSIWDGDYGFSPRDDTRQPERGAKAIMEVARRMMPRRYSISVVRPGPFSVSPVKGCHWNVTLLLVADENEHAYTMRFSFTDGMLTGATATAVALFEGKIP